MIYGDTLSVQEMHNSGDEENNTVGDEIDIVKHKIEIDNWPCIKSSVYIWVYLDLKPLTKKRALNAKVIDFLYFLY